MKRLSPDEIFLEVAQVIAKRGTCDRKKVGYVIVKDKRIVATGYNGSIAGLDHCDDVGHLMVNGHCLRTVHAEINALAQAAKLGPSIDNSTAYGTYGPPCLNCFKALTNAGVKKFVYLEKLESNYAEEEKIIMELAKQAGVELTHHKKIMSPKEFWKARYIVSRQREDGAFEVKEGSFDVTAPETHNI